MHFLFVALVLEWNIIMLILLKKKIALTSPVAFSESVNQALCFYLGFRNRLRLS